MKGNEASGALAGRRIVVTRAPEQAGEVVRLLQDAGAETIVAPMVRFLEAEDASALDRAADHLQEFDVLVFTSANAVRFFLDRCQARGQWPLPARLGVATVGAATRAALENANVEVTMQPGESSGAALAAEFGAEWKGKRVLLPRSDRAGDELPQALRAAGATVTSVVAYRTAAAEALDADVLAAVSEGGADAVVFFSPSAFRNFARALGDETLCQACARVAFAAIGPTTAAAIREAGVPVAVEAREATAAALVQELARYFGEQGERKARVG